MNELKETYTKILKQADIAISEATLAVHAPCGKNTGKSTGGLRLPDDGFDFLLAKLDLQMYEIPFPKDFTMTTQTVIFLDQFINCPYYLSPRSIYVTDEKKSMELHLFSGDLRKYGLVKAIERQKN